MAYGRHTRRGRKYWELRRLHFVPKEARELSKLSKKYPALQQMIAIRTAQWASFVHEANAHGWLSQYRRSVEWKNKILKFYGEERYRKVRSREVGAVVAISKTWMVEKDIHGRSIAPTISPWDWYDHTFSGLPDQLKWDTPRSHRVSQPDVKVDKIMYRRWIEDLKKSITRTDSRERKAQFREQIKNLEKGLKG